MVFFGLARCLWFFWKFIRWPALSYGKIFGSHSAVIYVSAYDFVKRYFTLFYPNLNLPVQNKGFFHITVKLRYLCFKNWKTLFYVKLYKCITLELLFKFIHSLLTNRVYFRYLVFLKNELYNFFSSLPVFRNQGCRLGIASKFCNYILRSTEVK